MASSSNSSAPRVARRNSSLFGAIKNIVAAPLTWLSGADQDDQRGKRRREQADPQPDIDEEVDLGTPRSKRIRVASPPRQAPSSSYLDPPSSAFQPLPKRRTPAPIARSSSASAYSLHPTRNSRPNVPRSTLSPIRLGRTMSIDPPLQIRRETSLNDVVMEPALGSMTRERSMPAVPLASRPSFRMRSSLTPQPREVSEPPPLTSLMSKPTFVRAPPAQREVQQPITTLGNLAETVRSNHSPVRQHSSLLFGSSVHLDSRERRSESVPVEKALYELDIYKTPLVPTRLRSANPSSSAAAIPDMFKSRRSSQLVLMNDDRKKDNGSHSSPKANETKPYAGEGGMKKLLARRKQEENRPDSENHEISNLTNEDGAGPSERTLPAKPVPAPSSDWFAVASAGATATSGGSSLRVGRTKTSRNHIARPAVARSRLKFSAIFEEDGDDAMDGEEEEARQRDRSMLEEASKKMPAFELPAGFSFAKPEAKPLQNDLTNAKEPPITSLPFSFAKPAQLPEPSRPEASTSRKENSEAEAPKPLRSLAEAPPLGVQLDLKSREGPTQPPSSGIPNFFANSALVTKTLSLPATPPLSFPSTVPSSSEAKNPSEPIKLFNGVGSSNQAPVNDKENPFWEGGAHSEAKPEAKHDPPKAVPHFFGQPAPSAPSTSSSITLPFSFGPPPSTISNGSLGSSAAVPFSFGNNKQDVPASTALATEIPKPAPTEAVAAPKPVFAGFGATAGDTSATAKPAVNGSGASPGSASSAFSFGPPSSTLAEQPKPLFAPAAAPKSSKSLFGSTPSVEAPKSAFGSNSQFSFNTEKPAAPIQAPSSPAPFTFNAAPSTPTQSNGTSGASGFSFSAPSPSVTPAPAPSTAFSFSGVQPNPAPAQSNAFTFGVPASVNPTERPVTPPKNNDQEYRMEESPTRETQAGVAKPSLNFSFNTNPSSLFGAPAQANSSVAAPQSSQFSFGQSAPNPFSPTKGPEEAKPFSFGTTPMPTPTATTPIAAPFSFGPSKSSSGDAVQRPGSGGGFSFGGALTPTLPPAPFSFGNTAPSAPPSLFVTGPTASTPSSPSTFNQPSPFSFNAPLPSSNTPFAFGSQPASPAGSNSGLPSSGFGAPSTGFGQAAPSSPFSSPAALAPSTSSGGTLFTIGAPPAQASGVGAGPRQIRKLPTRRTGAKR